MAKSKTQKERLRRQRSTRLRIPVSKHDTGTATRLPPVPTSTYDLTETSESAPSPSLSMSPSSKSLLSLPAETRINLYKYLGRPPCLHLLLNESHKSKRETCLNSKQFPLLSTCRLMRKEFLAYLLSVTTLTLRNGVRPRVRHNIVGFPSWQLCNIEHVAIGLSRKMQFDFFSRLKTLTLLWGKKPLEVQALNLRTTGYLWGDSGPAAMIDTAVAEVKSSSHVWIKKLSGRKKKRFRLQMQAVFGCRDHAGGKSNHLVASMSSLRGTPG